MSGLMLFARHHCCCRQSFEYIVCFALICVSDQLLNEYYMIDCLEVLIKSANFAEPASAGVVDLSIVGRFFSVGTLWGTCKMTGGPLAVLY